jgi:hypothetical protein
MGRRGSKRLVFLFFCAFIQLHNVCLSQVVINGNVSNSDGTLNSVRVILKDGNSESTFAYTFTDENGNYQLKVGKLEGNYILIFSSLGYESKTIQISLHPRKPEININVELNEKPMKLDEIVIQTEKPISIRNDTITFNTKYFVDGTEQTVEQLLKNIPGINVGPEGTIKVGNQEIEKLLVDGDDFFNRGYKILSKNMPAYPIEEVEVLKNYSNNRLLKGIEESNKVALNLKLNEKSKRIWFGNIEAAFGPVDFYNFKGNLMNFGKQNKYYLLTNVNNIGYDATGDLNSIIRPNRLNSPASLGDNQSVRSLLNLSLNQLNFQQSRTNFNDAELLSLNSIFNPTEKLKIKVLSFFNWDESSFFRNRVDIVDTNDANFVNTEMYELENKKQIAFGKLDLTYNISNSKMLEATTKYNYNNFNDDSNLVFNGNSTTESLEHNNVLFDQKMAYSNKFKDKKVFLISGRYIYEKHPQIYKLNEFFFTDLFPDLEEANNVSQQSINQMQFAGINAHLLDRKENGHLLEIQLGNEFRKDRLQTTFSILEDDIILDNPNGYQNLTNYQVNNLYFKSKYRLEISSLGITGKLDLHQFYNELENTNYTSIQNPFFVNPSLGFDWKINDRNKIITTYSFNTSNAGVVDVFSDFVLTGYRSFLKGTNGFNQLDSSSIIFNYQLGDWSDRFFATAFVLYSKNHDFLSTNTILSQNFVQVEKILIKDREFININSKLDYYLKFITTNLKLDLGYTRAEFKNIVNDSNLRKVTSVNFNYGFELRSGLNGVFNFHLGTKWKSTEVQTTTNNSFTDNISFIDLSFIFNKKFDIQVQSERYYFGNLINDNKYYFLDLEARYRLLEDKLILGINGKNLFNTESFRNVAISDIGRSTSEYRLLPRFVLLEIEYRF